MRLNPRRQRSKKTLRMDGNRPRGPEEQARVPQGPEDAAKPSDRGALRRQRKISACSVGGGNEYVQYVIVTGAVELYSFVGAYGSDESRVLIGTNV